MALETVLHTTRGVFIRHVAWELHKLFVQPRTWAGFGILAGVAASMSLLCSLESVQEALRHSLMGRGYDPRQYLTGLTYALLALRATVLLVGALFVALVAGESVAREVADRSMQMLLCRPVSRLRLLGIKATTTVLHTFALIAFLGLVTLGSGLLLYGKGGMLAYGPQEAVCATHDFQPGLWRYLLALPLLASSLCTVTALAFALSCFNIKPAAAAIGSLSPFFIDYVFRGVPYFHSIQGYFLTAKLSVWMQVFQPAIPWDRLLNDYAVLLAIDASLFVIGWAHFERRDLKP